MYYCERWIERLPDQGEHSGETAEEIWDALRCEEFTASRIVYLNIDGATEDTGDTDDETCDIHHAAPLWLDDPIPSVYEALLGRGWATCIQCAGTAFNAMQTPLYRTADDLEEHITDEHDGTVTVTPADEPPVPVMPDLRGTATFPTLDEIIRATHQTRTIAETQITTWHTDPQLPYNIRLRIQERLLREGINRPVGLYEGGVYSSNEDHYVMLRRLENLQGYPTNYAPFRFIDGPERAVRSTNGIWAES